MRNILIVIFLVILQSCTFTEEWKESDWNEDGKTDFWIRKIEAQTYETKQDVDFDNTIDKCSVLYRQESFDKEQIDINCDKTIDFITYSTDHKIEIDLNADGNTDYLALLQGKNNWRYELDTNYDGAVDAIQISENGNLRYCEVDENYDGKYDLRFDNVELFDNWLKANHPKFVAALKHSTN